MKKHKQLILSALVAVTGAWCAQAEHTDACITFSAEKPFSIKLTKGNNTKFIPPTVNIDYSTDKTNWTAYTANTAYAAKPDGGTYKIHFRGTGNDTFCCLQSSVKNCVNYFEIGTGTEATEIACSGNIMTLLDYKTVEANQMPTMGRRAFVYLFSNFDILTSSPELPATELTEYCYYRLFNGCTKLKHAPKLPATKMAMSCYGYMFYQCTSLTEAPELPATELAAVCYSSMFAGTGLTKAPKLPATELGVMVTNCYAYMFSGCGSLKEAPELPAKTLTTRCYRQMFGTCSSLTTMPKLPATTLAKECYHSMFLNCTNLVVNTAPRGKEWKISATSDTGATDWNKDMFGLSTGKTPVEPRTIPAAPALNTTYYIKSAKGTDLGGGLYAYDQGDGTYSVNGGASAALTKAGANLIKDKGVTNLVIGAGVSGVEANAFDGWRSLRSVEMGADCASVGSQAFLECYNLTNVTSKATTAVSVGDHAFYRCNSLESMDFGALPSFGTQSFTLQAGIYMKDGLPQVYSIPDITVGGTSKRKVYGTVELGDNVNWVDVTNKTDEERKSYHFFKIEAK